MITALTNAIEAEALWESTRSLSRGEFLRQAGQVETHLYYIVSGAIRVYICTENGEERVVRFGYAGSFITALDAYISGKPTEFYMQALRKCELKVISKARFLALLAERADLLDIWQNLLQGLVYQQIERELDLLTDSPQARYKRVFERSPQLFQEIPARHIASYLRMREETFSRIKKNFERDQKS